MIPSLGPDAALPTADDWNGHPVRLIGPALTAPYCRAVEFVVSNLRRSGMDDEAIRERVLSTILFAAPSTGDEASDETRSATMTRLLDACLRPGGTD